MTMLTITEAQLDSVARLQDDPAVLPVLRSARLSRNLAFLAAVVRSGAAGPAFRLLTDAQRRAPATVRQVLEHPWFGAWAAVCTAGTSDDMPLPDASQAALLAAFAASAAILAGLAFEIEVPAVGDAAVLPLLGALHGVAGRAVAVCSAGPDGPAAAGPLPAGNPLAARAGWRPLRRLSADLGGVPFTVELDGSPIASALFGAFTAGAVAGPPGSPNPGTDRAPAFPAVAIVDEDGYRRWNRRFTAAAWLLAEAVPRLAAPMREGMRTLIPVRAERTGLSAATLADAFGAAAMSAPHDTAAAASALLHEFQHSKLSVLSEIVPLVADDTPDLWSPWRSDPRPASAVLHGVYAHAAVAQLWCRVAAGWGSAARREAAGLREQTRSACAQLAGARRLTPAGRRFLAQLDQTVGDLDLPPSRGVQVPRAPARGPAPHAVRESFACLSPPLP